MSNLKPCPFCGSQNIATRNWLNSLYETRYFAECYDCGCLVGFMADPSGWVGAAYDTEAEAIEAWNTRYERTCRNLSKVKDTFVCSECRNETHGCMVDKFGCTVGFGKVVSRCPNCGRKVLHYAD